MRIVITYLGNLLMECTIKANSERFCFVRKELFRIRKCLNYGLHNKLNILKAYHYDYE